DRLIHGGAETVGSDVRGRTGGGGSVYACGRGTWVPGKFMGFRAGRGGHTSCLVGARGLAYCTAQIPPSFRAPLLPPPGVRHTPSELARSPPVSVRWILSRAPRPPCPALSLSDL